MNILRGLDIPTYMAHNFGGSLGYYDADKGTPDDPRATVDQLMAYSPAFYPSVDSVRRRSVAIGEGQQRLVRIPHSGRSLVRRLVQRHRRDRELAGPLRHAPRRHAELEPLAGSHASSRGRPYPRQLQAAAKR